MFMMRSAHRASRPHAWHGLFYYSVHLAGVLSKTFASSDTVCFGHRSGAIAGISKFIAEFLRAKRASGAPWVRK